MKSKERVTFEIGEKVKFESRRQNNKGKCEFLAH